MLSFNDTIQQLEGADLFWIGLLANYLGTILTGIFVGHIYIPVPFHCEIQGVHRFLIQDQTRSIFHELHQDVCMSSTAFPAFQLEF